jgi:transposase
VSEDLHGAYARVAGARAPQARVCADPFHVVKLANHALDEVRRAEWNAARHASGIVRRPSGRIRTNPAADLVKHTRWALLKDPSRLTATQQQTLDRLRRARHVLFRAWALKEELRDLYQLPVGRHAGAHLDAWLARACRCRIPAMVALSKTIRAHRPQILAAVELGLSNSKLEGLNSKIRLINHRGLRPPHRRRGHRHDLTLLLRPDRHAAYRKVRRTSFRPSLTSRTRPGSRRPSRSRSRRSS